MEKNRKKHNELTSKEQKTTAAFKMLSNENKLLKQSLKKTQDQLEGLRSKYHETDKQNSILNYKLDTSFIPELLKYLSSAIGAGFAVNYYFAAQHQKSLMIFIISALVYGGLLWFYRK